MMAFTRIFLIGIALIVFQPDTARAVKFMTASELISHCQVFIENPTSLDGIVCGAYVQGFLGGAEATDEAVARTIGREFPEALTGFERRAAQTRIGQRVKRFGPTAYAGYCLPRIEPSVEVTRKLVDWLADHPETKMQSAQDATLAALRALYPCN